MTDDHPMFSVIIPVYNRETLVAQTIDSVLAQPHRCQVICVDDGSTDNSRAVIRGYGDRVTLLEQQNKGPGAARNLGLTVATGTYIAYLDSDDLWFPWTTTVYSRLIQQHNNPAFITGKALVFTSEAEVSHILSNPPAGDLLRAEAYPDYLSTSHGWLWWSASSFVIRADELRRVGGMTDKWVNAEDADLALRLGTAPGFVHVNEPATFAWRSHPGSAMSSVRKNLEGVMHQIENEKAGRYPGGPARARDRRAIIAMHARPVSFACLRDGATRSGLTLYRELLPWHLRLGKLKYTLGYPLLAVRAALRHRPHSTSTTT